MGTFQNSQSSLAAPPGRPISPWSSLGPLFISGLFALLGSVLLIQGLINASLSKSIGGCILSLPFILIVFATRANLASHLKYAHELARWERTCMCTRCGFFYESDTISTAPAIPLAASMHLDVTEVPLADFSERNQFDTEFASEIQVKLAESKRQLGQLQFVAEAKEIVRAANLEDIKRLLRETADVGYFYTSQHVLLNEAVATGKTDIAAFFLLSGASPDGNNSSLQAPLLVAAQAKQWDSVELLLQAGASPNCSTDHVVPPLINAIRNRKWNCANQMLERGANPNSPEFSFSTPLREAIKKTKADFISNLLRHGADPNLYYGNRCPLMDAIDTGKKAVVEALVQGGANLTLDYADEIQSMHAYATYKDFPEIANYLQHASALNRHTALPAGTA